MIKKIRNYILALGTVFAFAAPAVALAVNDPTSDIQNNACQGVVLDTSATATDCNKKDDANGEGKVIGIVKTIINVLSLVVGAICVIMIIFGGFKYMTSGGESAGVTSAKNTILYAVVGLVVVLLAQAIVRFVFTRTTT